MTDWIIPGLLILITIMGTVASYGRDLLEARNRECWWWTGILLLLIWVIPNHYMAALLAMVVLGSFQIGNAWYILHNRLVPIAGLAGAYAILSHLMQPWMIPPVLWALVAVGIITGLWGALSWYKRTAYHLGFRRGWWGLWMLHDFIGTTDALCGQGNTMHTRAIVALSVASAVGLAWTGPWPALFAIPIILLPLGASPWHIGRWHPDQSVLSFLAIGLGLLILFDGWIGLTVSFILSAVLIWIAEPWNPKELWWDSGRFSYWRDAVKLWSLQRWWIRLIGFGTGTWFLATAPMAEARHHDRLFTAAHNEYVQQLVEHGLIGLIALLAYLGEAFYRTAHGGPEGQAVFLVGLTFATVAIVNFPWTFHHEWHPGPDPAQDVIQSVAQAEKKIAKLLSMAEAQQPTEETDRHREARDHLRTMHSAAVLAKSRADALFPLLPERSRQPISVEEWFGSPSLTALAFVIAVLAEAF